MNELKASKKFKSFIYLNKDLSDEELVVYINQYKQNIMKYDFKFYELFSSNNIEGNKMTIAETKVVLEKGTVEARVKDVVEALNLEKAMKKYKRLEKLSLEVILDIHKIITNLVVEEENWSGNLRDGNVSITNSLHQPPKFEEVQVLLENAIKKFNDSDKTIKDIYRFKLEFVEIHPFYDGNGRTSRIIQNTLLESIDMPRLIIRPQDKQYYYKALEDATVYGDRKGWIRFSLNYTLFMCINGLEFIKEIR
ncbi:Fic family protein [Clostridium tetani]|uniref:Fic family protein n=1 Tax=Clostridium tetani TaxID=1513 RepID=UPI0024A884EB|nr:Fic family protein [Clostridium tetani]